MWNSKKVLSMVRRPSKETLRLIRIRNDDDDKKIFAPHLDNFVRLLLLMRDFDACRQKWAMDDGAKTVQKCAQFSRINCAIFCKTICICMAAAWRQWWRSGNEDLVEIAKLYNRSTTWECLKCIDRDFLFINSLFAFAVKIRGLYLALINKLIS